MELEAIRAKLLELLKEIDYICKKYDITYYAEGGTIIGALRHNGFIPWDDDMDLVMTRDNFYKFLEAFKKEKLPNRVLECPDTNPNYPLVTIKYNDTTSTTIFRSLMNDICACGVYVDIFILDPIPKGRERWFKENFLSYTELLCPYYIINDDESSKFKYKMDLIKSKIYGREKVLDDYRKKLFCYNEEGNDEYLIRWGITYQTVKIDYYGEPRYVKFEDMEIPVPANAEKILANYFGEDWYYIPESQDQITHNFIQNLNMEYKYYVKDYMRFINKNDYMYNIYKSKELKMKKKDRELYNTIHVTKLNSFKDSINLQKQINKDIVKELYDNKKYSKLKEYSDLYFKLQNRGIYKKRDILLDLDFNTCYYLLMNGIITGDYYQTAYIIDLFIRRNKNKFMDIYSIVNQLKEAKNLYFQNKYNESLEIVNRLLDENNMNCSAYKIKLDIVLREYNDSFDYEKELKNINKFYKITNDIELKKYEGDIYYLLNQIDKAKECYQEFKESNCRNGLLLLDIDKKTE